MNIGSDIGNLTSIAVGETTSILESRLGKLEKEDEKRMKASDLFTFDDETLVMKKGDFENNLFKYEKDNFITLLYKGMYDCSPDCINNLVISTPAKQFQSKIRVDGLLEKLNKNRFHIVNDRPIFINKIEVVPEGYAIKINGILEDYEKYGDKLCEGAPTLVIDFGGETIDLIYFEYDKESEAYNFENSESIEYGLLRVYEEARNSLEELFNLKRLSKAEARKYFDKETPLRIPKGSNMIDVDEYRNDIITEALKKLINDILGYYPNIYQYNIVLCGGGAEVIYDTFVQLYEQTILEDDITINATGNKIIADTLFSDEDDDIELTEEVIDILDNIWEHRNEEKNENILINMFNNEQGAKILYNLYDVETIRDIKYNVKEHILNLQGK